MSRPKLQAVLEKALTRLESITDQAIRREFSNYHHHTFDFHPDKIVAGTVESLAKVTKTKSEVIVLDSSQLVKLKAAAERWANKLVAAYSKQGLEVSGYTATRRAEQKNNKSVDIFRGMTDSNAAYKKSKKEFVEDVFEIVRGRTMYYDDTFYSLTDAGHDTGYGASEQSVIYALGPDLYDTVDLVNSIKQKSDIHVFLEKIPFGMLSSSGNSFNFHVQMSMESSIDNKSTASKINFAGYSEQEFRGALVKELKKILSKVDWGSVEGSPSILQESIQLVKDAALGKKTNTKKPRTRATKKKSKTITKTRGKISPSVNIKKKGASPRDWLSMINVINATLPEQVKSNMGAPGLINRTGAFANSVRATTVQTTPQGYPSIGYTYDKTPYGVFDRRIGALPWATPERDPGLVIEKSIRQIASSLAIGRFYLRRE